MSGKRHAGYEPGQNLTERERQALLTADVRRRGDALCPLREEHTPAPAGYLAWSIWAEEKSKTHRQAPCYGCGLYVIWEPR